MAHPLKNVRAAFREVFVRPSYVALASGLAVVALLLAIWLPNLSLLAQVFSDAGISLDAKLGIALSLLAGIATNFNLLSASYTVAIAVLLGVDVALITYLMKQKRATAGKNVALSTSGLASGIVGIGCAACGSLILGGVLPSLGVAGALAALPLNGEEFGLLAVALLFASLILVARSIAEPAGCPLPQARRGGQPELS